MARPKKKIHHLLPTYAHKLQLWGINRRASYIIFNLQHSLDLQAYWRILRCDPSTAEECYLVANAIYQYGKKHKLTGFQDLEVDVKEWRNLASRGSAAA